MALDDTMVIPEHVALILDGNGRWAKKRGLPRTMGHKEGCVTVEKTVEIAARMGIKYLTVYGFSTELEALHRGGWGVNAAVSLLHGASLKGGFSQQCACKDDW